MVPVIFLSCWNFSCKRWIALIKCCTDIWSFETFFEMEPKLGIFNRVLHRLNYNRFSKTRLTFVDLHISKISKFHHSKFHKALVKSIGFDWSVFGCFRDSFDCSVFEQSRDSFSRSVFGCFRDSFDWSVFEWFRDSWTNHYVIQLLRNN